MGGYAEMKHGIIGGISRLALGMAGIATVGLSGAGTAQAAGFFIQEQSVTGLGRAFAGSAAAADDASTVFYNPAGMPFLSSGQVQFGANVLFPNSKIKDDGSTIDYPGLAPFLPNRPPGAVSGKKNSGNPYDPTPVPSGYVAVPVPTTDNRLWVGFGFTAPFGLEGKYSDDWFGRYDSTKTSLRVFDFQPTIAFRPTEWLSFGIGLNVSYAEATLDSETPNPFAGAIPGFADDGKLKVKGDSWAFGVNIGAMIQPTEGTRIGVDFRSEVDHRLQGKAQLTGLTFPPIIPGGAPNFNTDASAKLDLPPIVSVGIRQVITPQLTLLGGVTWYGWSSFKEIRVERADGGDDLVTPERFQDTVSAAIGGEYALTQDLTLRAGFQYDPTPTKSGFRSSRTPDGDRYWLSAGASYNVTENLSLDLGYSHIFIDAKKFDADREFYAGTPLQTDVSYSGKTESSVDILALGLRYRF